MGGVHHTVGVEKAVLLKVAQVNGVKEPLYKCSLGANATRPGLKHSELTPIELDLLLRAPASPWASGRDEAGPTLLTYSNTWQLTGLTLVLFCRAWTPP